MPQQEVPNNKSDRGEQTRPSTDRLSPAFVTLLAKSNQEPENYPGVITPEMNLYDQAPFDPILFEVEIRMHQLGYGAFLDTSEAPTLADAAKRGMGRLSMVTHTYTDMPDPSRGQVVHDLQNEWMAYTDPHWLEIVTANIDRELFRKPTSKIAPDVGFKRSRYGHEASRSLLMTLAGMLRPYPFWAQYLKEMDSRLVLSGMWNFNSKTRDMPSYLDWSMRRIARAHNLSILEDAAFFEQKAPHMQNELYQRKERRKRTYSWYQALKNADLIGT